MTLNTFPTTTFPGWSLFKAPNWATRVQRAVSGRELRVSDYVLPTYTFTLTWEILRDRWDMRAGANVGDAFFPPGGTPYDELRTIWYFFNGQLGAAVPFQFNDWTDNTTRAVAATPQVAQFATGDGVTTTFQMASALQAPVIPITINSVAPAISYSVDADTGLITFTTPPGNGVAITADMTYNYKVRFAADGADGEYFLYQLWRMRQLKMVSVLY